MRRSKSVHSYDLSTQVFYVYEVKQMAYQALYRKYRPQTFSDVVGQEHISQTLKNELASGKISHAYLFTGTRGTGKTSCAKILAKAVNCLQLNNGEPCGECEMCRAAAGDELTDIMEIDAASNNGVDNIRDLKEQVSFTPVAGKYRVYIIDEVHMLSLSAFNALLKTLEEPPSHVVFILATTEVHKLPSTILSRCQRFDFRRIDSQKICDRIQAIAANEDFTVTDSAATLIASAADGGMRDALSILDLCAASSKSIDEAVVANVCAMAGNDYLIKFANFIKNQDAENALLLLDELHNSSVDMLRLLNELTEHYRNLMIAKTVRNSKKPIVCSASRLSELESQAETYELHEILSILTALQETSGRMQTGNRRCEMEMAVIRLCNPSIGNDLASLERRIAALEYGTPAKQPITKQNVTTKVENNTSEASVIASSDISDNNDDEIPLPEPPEEVIVEKSNSKSNDEAELVENWDEVIHILQTTCPLIAGVLNGSSAYIKGQYLLIDTQNSQFLALVRGSNTIYRDQIRNAAQKVLGVAYKLGPYRTAKKTEDDPLLAFAEKLKNYDINS